MGLARFLRSADEAPFLVTVWNSVIPESIRFQNLSYSDPEYRPHGLNKFVEYPLDQPVYVPPTFFVGLVQTDVMFMNIGFDKNRDNSSKLFYDTDGFFAPTSQVGSLMLRPVFVSDTDPFLGIEEPAVAGIATNAICTSSSPRRAASRASPSETSGWLWSRLSIFVASSARRRSCMNAFWLP